MTRSTVAILNTCAGLIALPIEQLEVARRLARDLLGADWAGRAAPISPSSNTRLFCADEAASALGVKPSWLLQRAREGRIPHVKLGKYVRFDLAELRIALEEKP